ncbi:unnamed protein product [Cuscuta europaea]|uniref:DUF8039 domain-containing protein n=1 Tax=Cuscuta europaea TaxID=41803 RepID=A0A9P1EC01_CUSEU|nr:unnamed protein product [Cuscuta europaea]
MKRKCMMLSLLISGPKQPGNDIDVYLAPLIDDLKTLWDEEVSVFDAHIREYFTLRAMLFCTINDFPACGDLSGYKVKGKKPCPICDDDLHSTYLPHWGKYVYMKTRRYLPRHHPYSKKKKAFDGDVELRSALRPLTGKEVYERHKGVVHVFGKSKKKNKESTSLWKKESIFLKLPYWQHLTVRHCLDVMHIEKNVCDAIIGTLLNIPTKTKDGIHVQREMQEMQIRPELWVQDKSDKGKKKSTFTLPPACYTLSVAKKRIFCECLYNRDALYYARGEKVDHDGRVVGYGGTNVGHTKAFGKKSSQSQCSGCSSQSIESMKASLREEFKEQVNETVKQNVINILNEMGLTSFNFSSGASIPMPSTSINHAPHPLPNDELLGPRACRLFLNDFGTRRLFEVGRGTTFPSGTGVSCHHMPIMEGHLKVGVDTILNDYVGATLPVPVPTVNLFTIGDAQGSFVQWPVDWVKFVSEVTSSKPSKGKKKLDIRKKPVKRSLVSDGVLLALSKDCKWLHSIIASRSSDDPFGITFDARMFQYKSSDGDDILTTRTSLSFCPVQ